MSFRSCFLRCQLFFVNGTALPDTTVGAFVKLLGMSTGGIATRFMAERLKRMVFSGCTWRIFCLSASHSSGRAEVAGSGFTFLWVVCAPAVVPLLVAFTRNWKLDGGNAPECGAILRGCFLSLQVGKHLVKVEMDSGRETAMSRKEGEKLVRIQVELLPPRLAEAVIKQNRASSTPGVAFFRQLRVAYML